MSPFSRYLALFAACLGVGYAGARALGGQPRPSSTTPYAGAAGAPVGGVSGTSVAGPVDATVASLSTPVIEVQDVPAPAVLDNPDILPPDTPVRVPRLVMPRVIPRGATPRYTDVRPVAPRDEDEISGRLEAMEQELATLEGRYHAQSEYYEQSEVTLAATGMSLRTSIVADLGTGRAALGSVRAAMADGDAKRAERGLTTLRRVVKALEQARRR
ncbi:MAG: hypothetical protein IPK85_05300 [Gemmatimonadetes bacterium]|nr:hypothetical protein [Gemmatimonadota bacterium]